MEHLDRSDRQATRAAVAERAFHLVYQPIVHLDTGNMAGVEALCRFEDQCRPDERFKQAEALGLAAELDLAIIERALGDLPRIPEGYLAVNLSPSTLQEPALPGLLCASGMPANRLVVEVTEHAQVRDYTEADHVLRGLRQAGIRLAVDDAGAGYASFRHILSLRPDIIKMDLSITRDIDSDPARRALATALVIFAGEVGATVIAEGVETVAELAALQGAGIQRAQGYVLGRPHPLPLPPLDYTPLPLDRLLELSTLDSEPLLWTEVDASVAVTAHGLLSSASAIEGALALLRRRLDSISDEEYRALVATAERQARHIGGVLRDLVRGLPAQSLALLEGLGAGDLPI
jgi:EAL domain-containing protein (putative c-di-GMP-specific phosphodiesterase class I)